MVKPIFYAPLFVNGRTYTAKSVDDTNFTVRRVVDGAAFFALRTDGGFVVDGEAFPDGVFDAFDAAAKEARCDHGRVGCVDRAARRRRKSR